MPFGSLERRESELVILTVATARGCDYEREHHRLLGQRAGLSSAEIEGIVADTAVETLTDRERELLTHALDGAPVATIATRVHLSEGTVRNHLSSAIGKTGATTRSEAARIAQDRGWL